MEVFQAYRCRSCRDIPVIIPRNGIYWVECSSFTCNVTGAPRKTAEEAVRQWNGEEIRVIPKPPETVEYVPCLPL